MKKKYKKYLRTSGFGVVAAVLIFGNAFYFVKQNNELKNTPISESYELSNIPEYKGESYVTLNNNISTFTENDLTLNEFESYSDLDNLGRCGTAYAIVSQSSMPIEERTSIGSVKPSGWHTIKYDHINGKYLYNRCHLIGYQLTGENANVKNLITCTRKMNVEGMLPFENEVANYVKNTGDNVLYRVTPIFKDNNLVASGVQIEAKSKLENRGIEFNVFIYNVQDKIDINYLSGESKEVK